MAERGEVSDRVVGDLLEIEVDPWVSAPRFAPSEGNERNALLDQVVDAGILALGLGDDQPVGEAAPRDPAEISVGVFLRPGQQHHEVEIAAVDIDFRNDFQQSESLSRNA